MNCYMPSDYYRKRMIFDRSFYQENLLREYVTILKTVTFYIDGCKCKQVKILKYKNIKYNFHTYTFHKTLVL